MDSHLEYREIYALQDRVLDIVSQCETEFYLTGGTCLNRFIAPRRYSDDLDFFCNDTALFRDYTRDILAALGRSDLDSRIEVDTRDFIRLRINKELRVDLVNDRVFRYGHSEESPQGYRIDNIINLLANKISALIGRDEPKDLFDITTIHEIMTIDWPAVLEIVAKKSPFEKDYLLYRIQSFPIEMIDYLAMIKNEHADTCKKAIPVILRELENI